MPPKVGGARSQRAAATSSKSLPKGKASLGRRGDVDGGVIHAFAGAKSFLGMQASPAHTQSTNALSNRWNTDIEVVDLTAEDDETSHIVKVNDDCRFAVGVATVPISPPAKFDASDDCVDAEALLPSAVLISHTQPAELADTAEQAESVSWRYGCAELQGDNPSPPTLGPTEEYHLLDFSDMFQSLFDLPSLTHDASEEAMRVVVPDLPQPKVWDEGSNAHIPPYDVDNLVLPESLMNWRRVVIPAARTRKAWPLVRIAQQSPSCSVRLVQSLSRDVQDTVRLPVSRFSNWGKVNSLAELHARVCEARVLRRMLVAVCSAQNDNYWLPHCFHRWAPQHPRLMFAAIDRDVANNTGTAELRRELLGFDFIDGVSFVSHVPGEDMGRAFNGNKTSTEDILNSLMMRYRVSCHSGQVPVLERRAMASVLQVNWAAALRACDDQLRIEPDAFAFSFRMERNSTQAMEDVDALIPSSGFPIRSNVDIVPAQQPPLLKIDLLTEQLRSITWMQACEARPFYCPGALLHRASVCVPPFHDLSLHFRLDVVHKVRGGVLADCIGFGKTACMLGLVCAQPVLPREAMVRAMGSACLMPSRATLVVVPSHLVFQWAAECDKFLDMRRMKVITLSRSSDLPTAEEIVGADLVIASNALFDSEVYQATHLGIDLLAVQTMTKKSAVPKTAAPPAPKKGKGGRKQMSIAQAMATQQEASASIAATAPSKMEVLSREYIRAVGALLNRCSANDAGALDASYDGAPRRAAGKKRRSKADDSPVPKALPLEAFQWQRLVIDELHEAVAPASADSVLPVALRCLRAYYRWGLTATPALESLQSVDRISHLLHANTGAWDVECAAQFVAQCFSSSQRSEQTYPPPLERTVLVTLTPEELVLYKQRKFDLQRGRMTQHSLMEALLLQASHFALQHRSRQSHGGSLAPGDAKDQLQCLREEKHDRIEQLRSKKAEIIKQLDAMAAQLRGLGEDISMPEDQRRRRTADVQGRKEELQDSLHELNQELHGLQSSVDFFNQTLLQLRHGRHLPDCPICLDAMQFGSACIAPCGHVQCVPCAVQVATELGFCATCRQPLMPQQWRVLHQSDLLEADGVLSEDLRRDEARAVVKMVERPDPQLLGLGSKLAMLVTQICAIREHDRTAKILVYCQWNTLKMKVREALEAAQLPFSTLEGNADVLKEVLRKFLDPEGDASILVCSLEAKAAGLNLQAAQHIMFVHPFFSLNETQAAAWEAQAIGRVLRPGQRCVVNIWRFVSLQTVDQEILVRRQVQSWRQHFGKK